MLPHFPTPNFLVPCILRFGQFMTFDRGIWYRKPVLGSLWRPLRSHIVGGQYGNIRQIGQQYPSKKQRVAVSICLGGESGRFGRTWGRGCASGWVGGGGGGVGANPIAALLEYATDFVFFAAFSNFWRMLRVKLR